MYTTVCNSTWYKKPSSSNCTLTYMLSIVEYSAVNRNTATYVFVYALS